MAEKLRQFAVPFLLLIHAVQGTVECNVCTTSAAVIENVLLHNATASNTFQDAAAALCAHIPREMSTTCEEATARINNKVFDCLVKQLEIGTICADPHIDLCVAGRVSNAADTECEVLLCNRHAPVSRPSTHRMLPPCPQAFDPDPLACAACEFAVSGLQQYVNDTSTLIVKVVPRPPRPRPPLPPYFEVLRNGSHPFQIAP